MKLALAIVLLAATAAHADEADTIDNLPPALQARGDAAGLWKDHAIDYSVNPFYLRGDFDGDRKIDFVVGVTSADHPELRLVVLRAKGKPIWIEHDAFPKRDGWYVVDRGTKVDVNFAGDKPPTLKADAMMIAKADTSSAILYLKGKKFAEYWQGD